MDVILSASSSALKRVHAVAAGRAAGMVLLEGDRLVEDALREGLALELCLVSSERQERAVELDDAGVAVRLVAPDLLARVSRLVTSPGILALAQAPPLRRLESLEAAGDSLVAVACGLADPGNLGGLARTAEAAGARALVLVGSGAGPWNEKALRGSMGSLLRLPLVKIEDAAEAREGLARSGFRQARAATRDGIDYRTFDWSGPIAVWFSSETGELPPAVADLAGVSVPMAPPVESLNVAAAAAVILFAAGRSTETAG